MSWPSTHALPHEFQRAMIFIDGTNLFHRLQDTKLVVRSFAQLCASFAKGRQIIHTYLYTSEPHYEKAKKIHGEHAFDGVRVILGYTVPSSGSNPKEKAVDAALAADFVYHAANKNFDYGMLFSSDADFAHALRRVADFGCRTSVISINTPANKLLQDASDETTEVSQVTLVENGFATNQTPL